MRSVRRVIGSHGRGGVSLLEVAMATALLFVIGLMVVFAISFGLRQLARSKALLPAVTLAQQKMEEAMQKAPGKLTPAGGPFPAPTLPGYSYTVTYAPHPTLPALQTVLVEASGPMETRVAYAQVVPAGGTTNVLYGEIRVASSYPGLQPGPSEVDGILDTSTNTLYLSVTWIGAFKLQLGSSRVISGITLSHFKENQLRIIFTDRGTSPWSRCSLTMEFDFTASFEGWIPPPPTLMVLPKSTPFDVSSRVVCSPVTSYFGIP